MSIEQKSSFEKIESEQIKEPKEPTIEGKEKERQEINEKIYQTTEATVELLRNAWMRGKPDADWKERGYDWEQGEEEARKVCEFEAKTKEVLVDLMKEKEIDFTKGYTRLSDNITGLDRPDSIEYETMFREHRKFLDPDFCQGYREKLSKEMPRKEVKQGDKSRIYYVKDGQRIFDQGTLDYYERKLGLYKPEYDLGFGLEKFLGGRSVQIEVSGRSIWIAVKETIGYNRETDQFHIEPETAVKDVVGRLRIEKIPTITSDDKKWLKFYKE